MNLTKIVLILCFVIVAKCLQEEEGTTADIGTNTSVQEVTKVTSAGTSSSSNQDEIHNVTNGDIIFTREESTSAGTSMNSTITDDITTNTTLQVNASTTTATVSSTATVSTTEQIESNWTACDLLPCRNGGTCLDDPLRCLCSTGYTGSRCGVKDECTVGVNSTICNIGACVYSKDRSSRQCKCFFGMYWDGMKKECRESVPPCLPNPCHNGGTCSDNKNGTYKCGCLTGYDGDTCKVWNTCGDGVTCEHGLCEMNKEGNLKFCKCNDKFYWNETTKRCEDVVPPCVPNPCGHGGKCEQLSSTEFNCNCPGHYIDLTCSVADLCYSSSSDNRTCDGRGECQNLENSRKCICHEGYYLDEEAHTCREIRKPCFPNPCSNDGLCTPLDSNSYNCTCSEGYAGNQCEVQDLCVLLGGAAFCGAASCVSDQSLETFHCRCSPSQYFDFKTRKCRDMDLCPLMNCDAKETCFNSSCMCKDNYKRINNTGECNANICASEPCPIKDMICTEGADIKDYYCSCKMNFAFNGTHCNDVTCMIPSLNNCQQICKSTNDGFTCSCLKDLFELNGDNRTCSLIGNTTCSNKTCDFGSCLRVDEGEVCVCPPGYTETDGKCEDVCTSGSLKDLPFDICPSNQCEDTATGFRCKCQGKYIISEDKITCTTRRMCGKGEIGWNDCTAKNATCKDDWSMDAGYKCECAPPLVASKQGVCQDICSNEEYQRECSALGAMCDINTNGEKTCKCPPFFKKLEEGKRCSKQSDFSSILTIPLDLNAYTRHSASDGIMKRSLSSENSMNTFRVKSDIENAMAHIFPELTQTNVLSCRESKTYHVCKVELQFVSISQDDFKRLNDPSLCHSVQDSTETCLVPPSLILRKDRLKTDLVIQKTDPCEENLKNQLCGSETSCISSETQKSFNCTCNAGYIMRDKKFPFSDSTSFIEICSDVNECLEMNVCPQNTKCDNSIGSYSCTCLPGFRNKYGLSETKIDGCIEICNPNPCDHGSCEKKGDHDFECRCEAGFAGALCDLQDENFKHARTNTIIVGAVLGGVLLIVIIIFITTVSRLKKKKYQDDPDQMLYATEMTERRGGGAINNAYQRE